MKIKMEIEARVCGIICLTNEQTFKEIIIMDEDDIALLKDRRYFKDFFLQFAKNRFLSDGTLSSKIYLLLLDFMYSKRGQENLLYQTSSNTLEYVAELYDDSDSIVVMDNKHIVKNSYITITLSGISNKIIETTNFETLLCSAS